MRRLLHHRQFFLAAAAAAAFFLVTLAAAQPRRQQLRPDYYAGVCPDLEGIVRGAVRESVALSPFSAPATLRLFFHDCAVRGCDASVLLINPGGDDEWRSPDGMTLKLEGFSTVMSAKAAVDGDPRCRNRVSCADILALAARDSVFLSGGPDYEVELGRFDGRASTGGSVVVPHGTFDLDELNAFFSSLGLNQTDMIALSGGHTIGAASCGFFAYRAWLSESDYRGMGVVDPSSLARQLADPGMDPGLARRLADRCPLGPEAGGGSSFAFLDGATPLRFDNEYYRNLRGGMGVLASDQVLYADPRSRGDVERYADDQGAFFEDFAAAMTRLGRVGVRSEDDGEIRRDCRFTN